MLLITKKWTWPTPCVKTPIVQTTPQSLVPIMETQGNRFEGIIIPSSLILLYPNLMHGKPVQVRLCLWVANSPTATRSSFSLVEAKLCKICVSVAGRLLLEPFLVKVQPQGNVCLESGFSCPRLATEHGWSVSSTPSTHNTPHKHHCTIYTLHSTSLHSTSLHSTSLHSTSLHSTSLHSTFHESNQNSIIHTYESSTHLVDSAAAADLILLYLYYNIIFKAAQIIFGLQPSSLWRQLPWNYEHFTHILILELFYVK